jgi:DnaK suppressor protein
MTTTKQYREALVAKRGELTGLQPGREEIKIERMPDLIDDIQSSTERELAIVAMNQHWRTIRAIDQALGRIEEGSFGSCEGCGEEINAKRLAAIPWASLCRRCQEMKDMEAAREEIHLAA